MLGDFALGLGFRVWLSVLGFGILFRVLDLGCWDLAYGFGFRVFGVGLGFWVWGFWSWLRVLG